MRQLFATLALVLVVVATSAAFRSDGPVPAQEGQALFTVTGEVKSPGTFAWNAGMTVEAALNAAGGPTDKFDLKRSYIQRPVKDKDGNVLKFVKIMALKTTTPILPGDTLVAGRRWM